MTVSQQIITIAIIVAGTELTRFLPFLIFPAGKPTPELHPVPWKGAALRLYLA